MKELHPQLTVEHQAAHVLTNVDCNALDWGLLTLQEQRHILWLGNFLGAVRDDLAEYIF